VLLGVLAWAVINWAIYGVGVPPVRKEPLVPVFRFVNIGRDRGGVSQPNAIIWQTSTAPWDCAEVVDRRNRDEGQQIADLMSSGANSPLNRKDQNACAPFQLGEVEEGTKVEVLGECGQMARVRILFGSLQGREGCIETGRLSEGRHGAVLRKE
jgi:hypothetical protein